MKEVIALFILFLLSISLKANNEFVLYSEIGSFNKSYPDERFVGEEAVSFATFMNTLGGYYKYENSFGSIIGGGIVQTQISSGNINANENNGIPATQDFTQILNPYIFIGQNFGLWELELGLTTYLTYQELDDRKYYNEDGSIKTVEKGGLSLIRPKSYVFPNLKLRIFNDDWFHIKIRFAREMYNIIDSLFDIAFCYPYLDNYFEISISLKTPKNMFTEEENMLKSNQRLTFLYQYSFKPWTVGINFGFLLGNEVGGFVDSKGEFKSTSSFLNKFSAGLNISLKY